MTFDNFKEEDYEPDENEIRELNEILNNEKQNSQPKNRILFDFYTKSHFEGWLRTHGIKW